MEFIQPKDYIQKVNEDDVHIVIKAFNDMILKKGYMHRYALNTGLDYVPTLTDQDMLYLNTKAEIIGYSVQMQPDNYGTHSYIMFPINKS